ncbi:hypothetical protein MLD38_040876 [Melastoma candidum]|nr:hypothetical protein MLD38_040876 [Melastoma candidum]
MGIDRKDVRLVCHFNVPKSMEAFYQESGRAGRDQLPCRSILYYGIDDRRKMEFILANAGKNKSKLTSQDGLSKKSLADFSQMIEYCERSDCRRKKILESFGEQVPLSTCKKTCDACEHPSRVARYLQELVTSCATRQRNRYTNIVMKSSDDFIDEGLSSEFWNRADEASGSEEDISDSDDVIDDNCPTGSKFMSASKLKDRMEFLQRAEEKYYKNEVSGRQVKKHEKNAISEELRDAQKQRLSTAIIQALQRLGTIRIELTTAASTLENECFRKYGKSGKSFYLSQVASTIRWLTTTNSGDLMNRLETKADDPPSDKNPSGNIVPEIVSVNPVQDRGQTAARSKEVAFPRSRPLSPPQTSRRDPIPLPSIPTFSQFLKRQKPGVLNAGDSSPPVRPDKKTRL